MRQVAPLNRQGIERQLAALGLGSGMSVEVHSSLSRMGHVEGGAATAVEALLNVVGPHGAVVMSAYPVSLPLPVSEQERRQGISWKIRRFSEDSRERSGMGAIADTFRDRSDVVLGTGLHRVCAWGKDAARHAKAGYQHLADTRGLALLIGVGIDRCSSMHLSERVEVGEKARVLMNDLWTPKGAVTISEETRRQYPPDIIVGAPDGWLTGDPWTNAREEADRRGLIQRGTVGKAECMLFRVSELVGLLEAVYQHGPFRKVRCSARTIGGPNKKGVAGRIP